MHHKPGSRNPLSPTALSGPPSLHESAEHDLRTHGDMSHAPWAIMVLGFIAAVSSWWAPTARSQRHPGRRRRHHCRAIALVALMIAIYRFVPTVRSR